MKKMEGIGLPGGLPKDVHILLLETCGCNLIWKDKRSFQIYLRLLRWDHLELARLDLFPMTNWPYKTHIEHTQEEEETTWRQRQDESDVTRSQRTPAAVRSGRRQDTFSSTAFEGWAALLNFRCSASRAGDEYTTAVLSHQVVIY